MNRELVKEYKNGNKIWRYSEKCETCGGTGYLAIYAYHDHGVCYTCDGTGVRTWTEKELTPENQAIEDRRAKKWQATQMQREVDRCHAQALIEDKKRDDKLRREREQALSNWQGEIGQRITIRATLSISFYWETQFGVQYMHLMKDSNGNIYKWLSNKAVCYKNGNGDYHYIEEHDAEEFTLTGTVKEHAEYKGAKQTVLTRCKFTA